MSSSSETFYGEEWVNLEIEVNNDSIIKHYINGKEVFSYTNPIIGGQYNTLKDKMKSNAPVKQIENWSTVLQYYVATMVDNRIPGVASVAQRSGRALKSIKERLIG